MNPTDALPRTLRLLERPASRREQQVAEPPAPAWTTMIDRYFAWGESLQRQPPALDCRSGKPKR